MRLLLLWSSQSYLLILCKLQAGLQILHGIKDHKAKTPTLQAAKRDTQARGLNKS